MNTKPLLFVLLGSLSFTQLVSAQSTSQESEAPASELEKQVPDTGTPTSLPNPLVLHNLLDEFSQRSPIIDLQQAKLAVVQSELDANQVNNNLEFNLKGRLARREFAEEGQPHNMLALHVGKVLYDSGQAENQLNADLNRVEKEQLWLEAASNRQRLEVAKAYFNVLLADFQYRIDNEAMAIDYIRFDKTQDYHAIGQRSDVDLLESEHLYQASLLKRMQSEQAQLKTRVELANVLGLPDTRPDELRFPDLASMKARQVQSLELQALQKMVLEGNPQLNSLRKALHAQDALIQKAQDASAPVIRTDAWVGQLSSQPEVRDGRWKAQLTFDMPLYDGGAEKSATAKAKAQQLQVKAEHDQLQQRLRTQVADIFFELKLLATEKKVHDAFGDYADLYLDYSRALYENESRTDLGDSFVRLSQANYNMVAFEFKQALLWMELDYLLGNQVGLDRKKQSRFLAKDGVK